MTTSSTSKTSEKGMTIMWSVKPSSCHQMFMDSSVTILPGDRSHGRSLG